MVITKDAGRSLAKAATIATRYSIIRRQGFREGSKKEHQVRRTFDAEYHPPPPRVPPLGQWYRLPVLLEFSPVTAFCKKEEYAVFVTPSVTRPPPPPAAFLPYSARCFLHGCVFQ